MSSNVFLDQLDAHTLRDRLENEKLALIIPVGSLEQHGPHLPLGTDAMLSTKVAAGVAEKLGALVAPAFAYGYKSQQKSGGGNHLVGTTSLSAATVIAQTKDLVTSYLKQGFQQIIFLNGHYENYQFLYEGMDLALESFNKEQLGDRYTLLLSYWDYVGEETLAQVYPNGFPGWDIEHGGVLETALMLHLSPHSVDMSRAPGGPAAVLPKFDRLPVVAARTPQSGCLSAPDGATAEKGKLLYDDAVSAIAADLALELADAAVAV
ncbi:creatininase [Neomicrococcus lactis]|uniref:creatininase n=1 Tax=Neomicrococcus lactis TaxID=732241 RepID=UPI002301D5D7|nr:creatininase [Neomicrococcus lactis]